MLIEDNKAITFINQLKNIGVQIALDDFGTGYSSFSYLSYLKTDKVKLDKFLADNFMEADKIDTLINLINLLHSLDLPIVAEGVETKEQYLQLKAHNCDYIQGYYFSKPLAKDQIKAILTKNYI
nr:EAL domain-containing protein [Halanaerobium praevalens]